MTHIHAFCVFLVCFTLGSPDGTWLPDITCKVFSSYQVPNKCVHKPGAGRRIYDATHACVIWLRGPLSCNQTAIIFVFIGLVQPRWNKYCLRNFTWYIDVQLLWQKFFYMCLSYVYFRLVLWSLLLLFDVIYCRLQDRVRYSGKRLKFWVLALLFHVFDWKFWNLVSYRMWYMYHIWCPFVRS